MTWETVPLGSVADLRAGWTFPPYLQGRETGSLPFAKVAEISAASRGDGRLASARNYVDEADLAVLKARPIPVGSTVFAKIGESIKLHGRAYVARPLLIDNNAMAAIPRPIIEARYLFRVLQFLDLARLASTTSIPALRKSDLERLPIPLPPLPEQRRIAAILDEADALRSAQTRVLNSIDVLGEAAFRQFELKLDHGSPTTLGEIAEVSAGITKGRKPPAGELLTVDYMTVANVQDKRLDLSAVKQIDVSSTEVDRYRLRSGDLLLTEGGDPDKLGRGVVWNDELPLSIHQNHVFRVRLTDKGLSPVWLNWEVGSTYGKRYFLRAAKQTTGIATINSSQLKAFPVRVPQATHAAEFVAKLDAIRALRVQAVDRSSQLDALFASLQHRAFRGEL